MLLLYCSRYAADLKYLHKRFHFFLFYHKVWDKSQVYFKTVMHFVVQKVVCRYDNY